MKNIFIPNIRQASNIYDGHVLVTEVTNGRSVQWSYKQDFAIGGKTYGRGLLIRDTEVPSNTDYEYIVEDVQYPQVGAMLDFELVACACERTGGKANDGKHRKRVHLFPHRESDIAIWLYKRAFNAGFSIIDLQFDAQKCLVVRKGEMFDVNRTTYQGVIQVLDVDRFTKTLNEGLGTTQAFGMGLLTVIPFKS